MTTTDDDAVLSRRGARVVLLVAVFAIATCGLAYELVAGAVSTYLLGDAVTQYSLVIGVFLSAMGLGSWLAKLIRRRLLAAFVEIQIWIGLVGGTSSISMFAVNAFAEPWFGPFFYTLCAVIGTLVGLEIPLLVRVLRGAQGFSAAVSNVLALDYLGALATSLLFPFVALPLLGLSRASVAFGIMNLAVAAVGLALLDPPRLGRALRLAAVSVVLVAGFAGSGRLVGFLEDLLYQDDVVLVEQTRYQRIVLTRWRDDVRLYLDGHLQFSSIDEARYHEVLVHPAMAAAGDRRHVLILGGGDGLAAREVLKHPRVEAVRLVDIDPAMTSLARHRPLLARLNEGALDDPRVEIVHRDAFEFLEEDRSFYDVVVADLPDPSSPALARLYSRELYALAARRLAETGVIVTQATSPFFAREAFSTIVATVAGAVDEVGGGPLQPVPFHVHVPSFGEWGFVLAARHRVDPAALRVPVPTRYLTDELLPGLFVFGKDERPLPADVNRLDRPILATLYERGWGRFQE